MIGCNGGVIGCSRGTTGCQVGFTGGNGGETGCNGGHRDHRVDGGHKGQEGDGFVQRRRRNRRKNSCGRADKPTKGPKKLGMVLKP